MVRLWGEVRKYGKWVLLFPVIALIFTLLLLSIEDRNIFQSTWTSLTNWSWDMYRSDDGFHIYLGCIGILAGITEFLIVRKYMEN
ncbi:unknown [Odoribacter splanchnicus CAG:14]|nr:unknown [Odoribacter splanchnicus CAG:14]